MSIYNLGRVLPIFTGEYDNSKTYNNLDVVLYNGSSYVAINTTQGNLPTDTNHWAIVALAGTLSPEQVEYIQNQVIQYVQGQGYVIDNNYVHTDNNFSDAEKTKLDGIDLSTKQDVLQSGINIKTINGNSILGEGNMEIQTGGGGTSDYTQLSNKPSINGTTLEGNVTLPTMSDLNNKQDTLVSGTNIKTINHNSILGNGNLQIEGGEASNEQRIEIPVDVDEYDSFHAYIGDTNTITTSSSTGIKTVLIPVHTGDRYVAYYTGNNRTGNGATQSTIGYKKTKPVIGDVVENVVKFNSTTLNTQKALSGKLEAIAPYDGWMAFYCMTTTDSQGNKLEFELRKVETGNLGIVEAYNNTWIEEDIFTKTNAKCYTDNNFFLCTVTYELKENTPYKVIYRTQPELTANSLTYLDENMNELGNSGDQGGTLLEHKMEDLTNVPTGTKYLKMSYMGWTENKQGNSKLGMAALMKPLLDDGTIPQNEIVYCVSKIKKPLLPYNYTTENTTFPQDELWSAWAVRFPSGHQLKGKPTPLTSFFHGSSGYVLSNKISYPTYGTALHKEINDRGIAVFDINGYGISFVSDQYSRHWGCPAAVETVKAAYNVLTERFNCRKGMVLSGISMGGAIIKSYAMTYPEDCVACAMEAPSEIGGTFRLNGGVAEAVSTAWDGSDIELIKGYTPLAMPLIVQSITVDNNTYDVLRKVNSIIYNYMFGTTGTQVNNQLYAPFPVEAVIWHGDADTNVPLSYSLQFVSTTRNAGSNVKLRLCPNCTHDLNLFPWVKDEVLNYIESKLK